MEEGKSFKSGLFRKKTLKNNYNDNYEIVKSIYMKDFNNLQEYSRLKKEALNNKTIKEQLVRYNESDIFLQFKDTNLSIWIFLSVCSFLLSYYAITCIISGFIFLFIYFYSRTDKKSIMEYNKGVIVYNEGKPLESIEFFKNAYKLECDNIEALTVLARLMYIFFPEASCEYLYAVKKAINATDFLPLDTAIGEVEYAAENYNNALIYLQKKLKSNLSRQDNLKYKTMVGRCFYELGEFNKAIEILFINLGSIRCGDSNYNELLYWLALSEYEIGNLKNALMYLNKIFLCDSSYKNIAILIKQINEGGKDAL